MRTKDDIMVILSLGAGMYWAYLAMRRTRALNRSAGWPSTRGRILESGVVKDWWGRSTDFLSVRYEFTANERVVGYTPRLSGGWFWSAKRRADFTDRYHPGQEVEVFYDPSNPQINCLDRTDRGGITTLWWAVVGSIAFGSLILGWAALRRYR
jgi:hypothetical protein